MTTPTPTLRSALVEALYPESKDRHHCAFLCDKVLAVLAANASAPVEQAAPKSNWTNEEKALEITRTIFPELCTGFSDDYCEFMQAARVVDRVLASPHFQSLATEKPTSSPGERTASTIDDPRRVPVEGGSAVANANEVAAQSQTPMTPKYAALLKEMERVPRSDGDKMLHAFARQMEQTYMDSRFDDITKIGSEAIWKAVQEIGPWSESNDMPWEDEILCGLSIAKERFATLETALAAYRLARQPDQRQGEGRV